MRPSPACQANAQAPSCRLGQERRRLARRGHTRAARHHLPDSMVPHHCAAVPMSRSEVQRGTYQPATELAETIGKTQRMEIMK
jgi:uncharacterized protein (DUF305 family)